MTWNKRVRVLAVTALTALAAGGLSPAAAMAAPAAGQLVAGQVQSAAIGGVIDYTLYLPPGYDADAETRYPSAYLLHGRGDTQAAWQQMAPVLDEMIADGSIPPLIVVMPDAPWSNRGGYYTDSAYTGSDPATTPGAAVETAFTSDLVDHVDATYATVADRAARVVGGYSMGGAGAVRFATVHQDLFAQALALSPAVYVPTTPVDSSTREFGAYGVGDELYVESRYQELSYPTALAGVDPALPVHMFIAVGDDEYVNPNPEDAVHDLDYEAATLYNRVKRVPGLTAEFRTYDGGHDWGVWERGFREGMLDIAPRLATEPPPPFEGTQTGSAADDFAGGVFGRPDGSVVQAIAAGGATLGVESAGGTDIVVQSVSADGESQWVSPLATPLNERSYGVVDGGEGAVIVGGYRRIDHDGAQNDDMLVSKLSAEGEEVWTMTFGDPTAADRAYGVAADGTGGAYLAGYTSGTVDAAVSAGDKDIVVARIGGDGEVLWTRQFGSSGEDKAFSVAVKPDGGVVVGGTAGGAMPDAVSAGSYDGWVASFSASGEREWLRQVGSASGDQVSAVGVLPDGGVIAAGWAGGDLATAASSGSNDVLLATWSASGEQRALRLRGSADDDRAAAVVVGGDGRALVSGFTAGQIGAPAGGVDAFSFVVDATAGVDESTLSQYGSAQRDAADEYDEANLFASSDGSAPEVWVQAVTYGAVDGAVNAGGADVFLTRVPFAASVDSGNGAVPGAPGSPAAAPGDAGAGAGVLGATGGEIPRGVAVALAAVLAGAAVFLIARRRALRTSR